MRRPATSSDRRGPGRRRRRRGQGGGSSAVLRGWVEGARRRGPGGGLRPRRPVVLEGKIEPDEEADPERAKRGMDQVKAERDEAQASGCEHEASEPAFQRGGRKSRGAHLGLALDEDLGGKGLHTNVAPRLLSGLWLGAPPQTTARAI